jgi:hypothetical protein
VSPKIYFLSPECQRPITCCNKAAGGQWFGKEIGGTNSWKYIYIYILSRHPCLKNPSPFPPSGYTDIYKERKRKRESEGEMDIYIEREREGERHISLY